MKTKWLFLVCCICTQFAINTKAVFKTELQGQSKGDTNWINVNLQNWKELDYIPLRVAMSGGPVNNQLITVNFDHTKNSVPGIQNLIAFVPSTNVVITSMPTLTAPLSGDIWTYTFTVNVLNGNDASVEFLGRLSAGAHLFVGSSLGLSSPTLQIHKPAAAPGTPDLLIQKTGPSHAAIGQTITYTIFYTNITSPFGMTATGVQISDLFPPWVTYVPGSATGGGVLAGNTLTWDLNTVFVGNSGTLTYQVKVNTNALTGHTFTNWARIFSAENDTDYANNESTVTTLVDASAVGNSSPFAANDSYSTPEDQSLLVTAPGVLTNDTDPENDPLIALVVTSPTHGTLNLGTNGAFTYVPATNYNGPDSFTYRINDGTTNSSPATVNITVQPVNDGPFAVGDSYSTTEDVMLVVAAPGVLTNDSDIDGDALVAAVITPPIHGTVTLSTNGSFIYIPNTNFFGSDSFTYRVSDGLTNSPGATVAITVLPANDAPLAVNDSYGTVEDTVLNVSAPGVLANDSDIDGDVLVAIIQSPPLHGVVTLDGSGSFTYAPVADYNGPDSFTYIASDGAATSAVVTVNITVAPSNDPPIANSDSFSTLEDTVLIISAPGVLANDSDLDGDILTAAIVIPPTHGNLTLNTNGEFTYTPATNYHGTDSFSYRASDDTTNSAPATVTITVQPVNDPPVAMNDSYSTLEDVALNVTAAGVLTNDSDVDGDTLVAILVSLPSHGSLTLNTNGSFTYAPATNYNGPDSFTYRASDGLTNSAVAAVTITVQSANDAPVAVNDSYGTLEDTTLNVVAAGVLTNDTDVDGDTLTAALVSAPAHGSLTLDTNGSFSYTPATNYNGSDSFTYRASDGIAISAVATVTITVQPVNDPPVAVNDSYSTAEDTTLNVAAAGVLVNDTDPENNLLTTVLVSSPTHGTLTLNTNGSFLYTPATNYNGPDSFTYRASDGLTNSAVATVAIAVQSRNDAPAAVNDSYSTPEDTTLTLVAAGVLTNDTDVDGDALNAVLVSLPTHGALTLNTNGSFSYTPATNYSGSDSFTYRASDGIATSAVAIVRITVQPVNDPPVAVNDSYSIPEDTTLNVAVAGVLANDTDPENDVLTAVLVSSPTHGTLTLNTNGSFVYTPATNYNGSDSFSYRASDGLATSAVATVNISIGSANDPPIANNDAYTTDEDVTLNVPAAGVLSNDTDTDANSLIALVLATPTHGTLALSTNGSFTYVPATNYNGTDTFTYRANDGITNSAPATVTITIRPINDRPVAVDDSYSTDEDVTLNVLAPGVLTNDSDIETNALTATLVTAPAHGSITLNANGSFSYTPAVNYNGSDSFTYRVNDGATNSAPATVSIVVRPVNDSPSFTTPSLVTVNEDCGVQTIPAFATNISPGATNEIGQQLSFITTNNNSGLFVVRPAISTGGELTFTPAPDAFGTSVVTIVLKDNGGTSNGGSDTSVGHNVTIVVVPVNDPPGFTKGPDQFVLQNSPQQTVTAWATGITAGPSNENGQTVSFVVTNDNPTLFSQAPQLGSDGTLIYTPSPGAFGVAHINVTAQDNGGTANGGVDESAPQQFLITVNGPPRARIISPTNGSVFMASVPINILCDAIDPDGTVTNLALYRNNGLTVNLQQSYLYTWTNPAPGTYQLDATATDNSGLTGAADPVSISVISEPPLTIVVQMHFNPQTGLFEQKVRMANPTSTTFDAVRVLVSNLPSGATVYNASGSTNGVQYVQYNFPILAGRTGDLTIEYYVPNRVAPNPILSAAVVLKEQYSAPPGTALQINRSVVLADGSVLLDFRTESNRVYYIQYSTDLNEWHTAMPGITGTGSGMQWVDNGPPKTDVFPATRGIRVYRMLQMP